MVKKGTPETFGEKEIRYLGDASDILPIPAGRLLPGYNGKKTVSGTELPLLKTPSSLLHVTHRITELQYRLWILFCGSYLEGYKLTENPSKSEKYSSIKLPLSELRRFLGWRPDDEELLASFRALSSTPIVINLLNKNKTGSASVGSLISQAVIDQKDSSVIITLPPLVIDAILGGQQEFFALLNWAFFNELKKKYSSIIYKLCVDYAGHGATKQFTLDEWRSYCGLDIPRADTGTLLYSTDKELVRQTITNPLKELRETSSDLDISIEQTLVRRKISSFRFIIQRRSIESLSIYSEYFVGCRFDLAESIKAKAIQRYSIEQCQACIKAANRYIDDLEKKGTSDINMGGIYNNALKDDWGSSFLSEEESENIKREEARILSAKKKEQERKEKLKEELSSYVRKKKTEVIQSLSNEEMAEKAATFSAEVPDIDYKQYNAEKGKFNKSLDQVSFRLWLMGSIPSAGIEKEFWELNT